LSDYFIGDIQGCYSGLKRALSLVDFQKGKDTLWLTGDLVARGPDSLKTLRFLYKNSDCCRTVLGNHDLHFLAVANGIKKANPKDKLEPLLASPKLSNYIDWLRAQPLLLALPDKSGYMSHAGLPPHWKPKLAKTWAANVETQLQSKDYVSFLPLMYGNKPSLWLDDLSEQDMLRYTISALTRMRYCFDSGELDFEFKCSPDSLEQKDATHLKPWFEFKPKRFTKNKWIFGHWASLMGTTNNDRVIALDTGYVWGNSLTMLDWQSGEKLQVEAK